MVMLQQIMALIPDKPSPARVVALTMLCVVMAAGLIVWSVTHPWGLPPAQQFVASLTAVAFGGLLALTYATLQRLSF